MKIKRKGFTLVELLAVIVIVSILVLLAVPIISRYVDNSKKKAFAENAIRAIEVVNNYVKKNNYYSGSNFEIESTCDEGTCYYDLNQVNLLLDRKLDISPFGASYNKSISKVAVQNIETKNDVENLFYMCLIDDDQNGFAYTMRDKINYSIVSIGNVSDCEEAANFVTADANGGTIKESSDWAITSDQVVQKKIMYNKMYGVLPTATKKGSTFLGWYTAQTGGTKIEETTKVKNPLAHTIYAHWEKNSYVVTADANGGTISSTTGWTGTGNTATKELGYGEQYGTLPIVSKEGAIFKGWYTAPTGGTQISSTTEVTQDSNHSIYARWDCIGINPGTYTVGSQLTYAGNNWTVVSDNSDNISLALNGLSGSGSYNNASDYLTTNFVNTNSTLKNSKELGCLVSQNGAYVTTDSGSNAANKPSSEHWVSNGYVYLPHQINYYWTGGTYYVAGYASSSSLLNSTYYSTSIGSSVQYAAGSIINVGSNNSSVTFNSATYSSSGTGLMSDWISWIYLDKDYCSSPSSKKLAIARSTNPLVGGGGGLYTYCTTKTLQIVTCGGSYSGGVGSWTAKSSTTYSHTNPSGYHDSTSYYSSENSWPYAGTAHSTTSGKASSNLVRTFNMITGGYCGARTVYTVGNLTKTIYYRPMIKVVKK